jgi:hypothetical protein
MGLKDVPNPTIASCTSPWLCFAFWGSFGCPAEFPLNGLLECAGRFQSLVWTSHLEISNCTQTGRGRRGKPQNVSMILQFQPCHKVVLIWRCNFEQNESMSSSSNPFCNLKNHLWCSKLSTCPFKLDHVKKKMWIVRWPTSNHLKTIRGWDSCFESMPLTGPCVLNIQWWKKRSSWAVKTTPLSHLNG